MSSLTPTIPLCAILPLMQSGLTQALIAPIMMDMAPGTMKIA